MATTAYGVNNTLTVKLWSKKLFHEALAQAFMSRYMGESSDSLIQVLNDTKKGAGDRVTVGLRMQLAGAGIQGDGTLEGNEEALTTYTQNVFIDQLRHAVRSSGKMSGINMLRTLKRRLLSAKDVNSVDISKGFALA